MGRALVFEIKWGLFVYFFLLVYDVCSPMRLFLYVISKYLLDDWWVWVKCLYLLSV